MLVQLLPDNFLQFSFWCIFGIFSMFFGGILSGFHIENDYTTKRKNSSNKSINYLNEPLGPFTLRSELPRSAQYSDIPPWASKNPQILVVSGRPQFPFNVADLNGVHHFLFKTFLILKMRFYWLKTPSGPSPTIRPLNFVASLEKFTKNGSNFQNSVRTDGLWVIFREFWVVTFECYIIRPSKIL